MAFTFHPDGYLASRPWKWPGRPTPAPRPSDVFGTPAKPKPPGPDVSWQDSGLNVGEAGRNRDLADLEAGTVNAQDTLGSDYGITFNRDPNDPTQASGFSIDPNVDVSNPFSRAALLKRAYQGQEGAINSGAASAGQFYSGATQAQHDSAGFNFQQGNDALLKSFAGDFGNLYGNLVGARRDAQNARVEDQGAAIGRHENDPAYARPKPAGPSPGSVFGPRPTAPKPSTVFGPRKIKRTR